MYRQGVYLHFSGIFVFPIYTRCLFSLCSSLINPDFSLLPLLLAHTPFYHVVNHLRFSPLPLYRSLYAPTRPLLYKEASLFIAAIHPPSALSQSLIRPFISLAIPERYLSFILYIIRFLMNFYSFRNILFTFPSGCARIYLPKDPRERRAAHEQQYRIPPPAGRPGNNQ